MTYHAEPGSKVYVVRTASGSLCSIKADKAEAESACERWNADPFNDDGTPDTDGPYRVEPWVIT